MEEKQILVVTDWKTVTLNSVKEILGCDENTVVLNTTKGKLTIEGNDLKIESLEKQNGNLFVKGEILAVYYNDIDLNKKGFFSRFFEKK